MDERTMFELLEVYDAVCQLEKVGEMLYGAEDAPGYGEGILGNLSYVADIIMRNSPIYVPGEEIEDTEFGKILFDKEMDNKKKARLLLGAE